jgi:hypothetical protein
MLRSIQKAEARATHVLSICDDDGLRLSRELLLLKDGYKTESIQSNAALTVSRVRSFDLALICRSINRERAIPLVEMLRRFHPAIQILAIKPLDPSPDLCDADFEVPSGPQAILNEIRSSLQQGTADPGRMTIGSQTRTDRAPASTNRVNLAVDQAPEEAGTRSGGATCTIRPLLLNSKPSNSADFFTRVKGPSSAAKK